MHSQQRSPQTGRKNEERAVDVVFSRALRVEPYGRIGYKSDDESGQAKRDEGPKYSAYNPDSRILIQYPSPANGFKCLVLFRPRLPRKGRTHRYGDGCDDKIESARKNGHQKRAQPANADQLQPNHR